MLDFSSLNQFKAKEETPSDLEFIYYLFWEKGISLSDIVGRVIIHSFSFNLPFIKKEFKFEWKSKEEGLPIPYIFGILKVNNYVKKKEEEEYKKAQRKR